METKKSVKANLENGKPASLLMGLTVALALLFVSFEWGVRDIKLLTDDRDGGIKWEEEMPVTIPEATPPPPPPPTPLTVVTDVLIIVDDWVDTGIDIASTEDTPDTAQRDVYVPPANAGEEEEDASAVFIVVEDMPQFPGGEAELLRFINKSIKYPVLAQENNTQGRVVCSFVVNRDGSVVDAEIVRGVDPSLDKEAIRVINTMPKWTAGKQRGKPVRVKYTIPITFRLQ
ncbi:MAG: energy transducer TonB [Tannerellaceae bacterium]|jgi:protein TonB|nr:energy transducer TonB [Tannerellaceae bacterium]